MTVNWLTYAVGALVIAVMLGVSRALAEYTRGPKREKFAAKYLSTFHKYINSNGSDWQAYGELIYDSAKMQGHMGEYGLVSYQPPFANGYYPNHPIILNFIPEIKRHFDESVNEYGLQRLDHRNLAWFINSTNEAIIRYSGSLATQKDQAKSRLFNPIQWVRLGIERILAGPIYLLSALGLVSGFRAIAAENSVAVRFFSGLTILIGALAAASELIVNYPAVMAWIFAHKVF